MFTRMQSPPVFLPMLHFPGDALWKRLQHSRGGSCTGGVREVLHQQTRGNWRHVLWRVGFVFVVWFFGARELFGTQALDVLLPVGSELHDG